MNKEPLIKLRYESEASERRKHREVTRKNTETIQACCDGVRGDKDHLQLNLASDVEGNKKGCYTYISSKRNTFGPAAEWGRGYDDKG